MSEELEDFLVSAIAFLVVALLFLGFLFFWAIVATIVGAFIGWAISVTPLTMLVEQGFRIFGLEVKGYLPHIGATLGFISSFFTAIFYKNQK